MCLPGRNVSNLIADLNGVPYSFPRPMMKISTLDLTAFKGQNEYIIQE